MYLLKIYKNNFNTMGCCLMSNCIGLISSLLVKPSGCRQKSSVVLSVQCYKVGTKSRDQLVKRAVNGFCTDTSDPSVQETPPSPSIESFTIACNFHFFLLFCSPWSPRPETIQQSRGLLVHWSHHLHPVSRSKEHPIFFMSFSTSVLLRTPLQCGSESGGDAESPPSLR